MSDRLRVVVCDDDANRVQGWRERIEAQLPSSEFTVEAMPPAGFARAVRALNERLREAKSGSWIPSKDDASIFDQTDILVLDSDLTPDPTSDAGQDPNNEVATYLVGEIGSEVARLARTFTEVSAIVIVNQGVKSRTFDLTMMRMAAEPADLYVTHDDIDNARAWLDSGNDDFRPWAWPLLAQLPRWINEVAAITTLSMSVVDVLGMTHETTGLNFTLRQLESLIADGSDISTLTVRDVAQSADFGLGLRPKEKTSDEFLLRVGVCGLRRWLDRVVVPPQNVLIDLPHLLQSNPWLVSARDDLASWNDRTAWWYPAEPNVATEAYNEAASHVLGRNVWNVTQLPPRPADGRLRPDDPVFCEDTSDFRPIGEASDFVSDIEGPYGARFVAMLDDVDYMPRHRLFK